MKQFVESQIVAVDVGNSRIKIGSFLPDLPCEDTKPSTLPLTRRDALPQPCSTLGIGQGEDLAVELERWIEEQAVDPSTVWWLGSVNRPLCGRLREALKSLGMTQCRELEQHSMPIEVRVETPRRAGIDRLAAAAAANAVRQREQPVIVVDHGTAITVDLVAADGAFEGGAILPGVEMAARALQEQTDALPRSPRQLLNDPPPVLGRSTMAAIESGLFWGAMGGVGEIVAHLSRSLSVSPELLLTGGMGPQVAEFWRDKGTPARFMEHLVLSGIALSALDR